MSKSNGCDSNGQKETEGTGGQRGKGQARSKAGRLKKKKHTKVVCCCCFSEFTSFWGFIWRCNDMHLFGSTGAMPKYLSNKPCSNSERLRFRKRKVNNQENRVPAELCWRTMKGSVVSEVGTLLSGVSPDELPSWCSVRGCLEDNGTILSQLASPKRFREVKIPNFTYVLGSTPKLQSLIMSYGWLWLKIWFQFIDEVQGS